MLPWTLANVVRTHARARARRPMITYGQRTITYAEMDERSSRVARALAAEGVAAQDRVAFLDKNGRSTSRSSSVAARSTP